MKRRSSKGEICNFSTGICKENFFAHSKAEKHNSSTKLFKRMGSIQKLVCNLLKTDYWPCDQLREHGNKTGKIEKISYWVSLPAVHINGVAHRLEGVKTNAQWEQKPENRNRVKAVQTDEPEKLVITLQHKAGIFKESEKREVRENGDEQCDFSVLTVFFVVATNDKTTAVINEGGKKHQQGKKRI